MCNDIKQKKWLRHLVLPSAFSSAEMLRLPCGVKPPFGFGSFFVDTKNAECFPFRKSSFTDPFLFLNKFKIKMAPAPGFEPGTKWLTATYSTAELCRSMNKSFSMLFNIYLFLQKANYYMQFFCLILMKNLQKCFSGVIIIVVQQKIREFLYV